MPKATKAFEDSANQLLTLEAIFVMFCLHFFESFFASFCGDKSQ